MDRTEPNSPFKLFAEAAEHHALARHNIRLDDQNIAAIDRIFLSERLELDSESCNSLTLCYGAWIGQWMVRNLNGKWVGLHEPTPPRIRVNGNHYSPMDAVKRLLTESTLDRSGTTSFEDLLRELINHNNKPREPSSIPSTQFNLQAWNTHLASDQRFVRTEEFPESPHDAIASLDPWIRDEINEGLKVLCLAAGGGTHGPLLAIAGAHVTVVDFSSAQLAIDRKIAEQFGLEIQLIESSMEDLSMLSTSSMDLVVQPVSMCYVSNALKVYKEVARVLRPNGTYVAQHKSPTALQADYHWSDTYGYSIQTTNSEGQLLLAATQSTPLRERGTQEYFHSLDQLLGGLCQTGFIIEDFSEPIRGDSWASKGSFEHRSTYLSPYLKIKARRQSDRISTKGDQLSKPAFTKVDS